MKKVLLASAAQLFLNRNLELLRRRGFQLCSCTRGEDAVRLNEKYHFDLILTDMVLEETDGCTLCSRLLQNGEVPVILVCHNTPNNMEKVEQSGAIAVILKPVDPVQLMEIVGRYINLSESKSQRVKLKVEVLSKTSEDEFFCLSHDISSTGMSLASEYQLTPGNHVSCQFILPDSSPVETIVEIVRSAETPESKTLYGVKFTDHPEQQRRAINNYVTSIAGLIANA